MRGLVRTFLVAAVIVVVVGIVYALPVGRCIYNPFSESDIEAPCRTAIGRQYFPPEMRADAAFRLGYILNARGLKAEALKAFTQSMDLVPTSARAQFEVGMGYFGQNEFATANSYLSAYLNNTAENFGIHQRNYIEAHRYRGWSRFQTGQLDAAVADYNEVLTKVPADGNAHIARGQIFVNQGRLPEALMDFEAGILAEPNNTAAIALRAAVLGRLGRK